MLLYHTSPQKIDKITSHGMFNDCLFFASTPYCMTSGDGPVYVYSIEIDEDLIVDVDDLYDAEIVADIARVLDIDEDTAADILDGSALVHDVTGDCEDGWYIQAQQGAAAKKAGYAAACSQDEQGAVYIVPMLGRESDLTEVEIWK
jgi:hypothetical protein